MVFTAVDRSCAEKRGLIADVRVLQSKQRIIARLFFYDLPEYFLLTQRRRPISPHTTKFDDLAATTKTTVGPT